MTEHARARLVVNHEWTVLSTNSGWTAEHVASGRTLQLPPTAYSLLKQFAFPTDAEEVVRTLTDSVETAAEIRGVLANFEEQRLLVPVTSVADGPSRRGFFGARSVSLATAMQAPPRSFAFVGMPYDDGAGVRSGSKNAPERLRAVSKALGAFPDDGTGLWDPVTEEYVLQDRPLMDLGDVSGRVPPRRREMLDDLRALTSELSARGTVPVVIGGDHSISLPAIQGVIAGAGPLGVIHFDAHSDISHAATSDDEALHHGNVMGKVLGLEGVGALVQLGVRQLVRLPDPQHAKLIAWPGRQALGDLAQVRAQLPQLERWYVTIDIDVLDPGVVPSTGTPLPNGWTLQEFLVVARAVCAGLHLVGVDMVELIPEESPASALAAAQALLAVLDS